MSDKTDNTPVYQKVAEVLVNGIKGMIKEAQKSRENSYYDTWVKLNGPVRNEGEYKMSARKLFAMIERIFDITHGDARFSYLEMPGGLQPVTVFYVVDPKNREISLAFSFCSQEDKYGRHQGRLRAMCNWCSHRFFVRLPFNGDTEGAIASAWWHLAGEFPHEYRKSVWPRVMTVWTYNHNELEDAGVDYRITGEELANKAFEAELTKDPTPETKEG